MEHPHGSHINAERIGINLSIKHNVTIGMNKGKRPIIGNNVSIACGACVLGGKNRQQCNYWSKQCCH